MADAARMAKTDHESSATASGNSEAIGATEREAIIGGRSAGSSRTIVCAFTASRALYYHDSQHDSRAALPREDPAAVSR